MNAKEEFQDNWKKFSTQLKGRMLSFNGKTFSSSGYFNELLESEREFWSSNLQEGGRWLKDYSEKNPENGKTISGILCKDMCFMDVDSSNANIIMSKVCRVVLGLAIGFSIVSFGDSAWIQKLKESFFMESLLPYFFALLCGIVFYFIGMSVDSALQAQNSHKLIEAYMKQLEKFKLSVESILQVE